MTGKRKEMPAEVMPTSLSTAVSRPGLWSERNNLPFLQNKANFILPNNQEDLIQGLLEPRARLTLTSRQ